jgi:hypothetical protein
MILAQVAAPPPTVDWQVIILAVVAMIPGLVAAYFANQARGTAHEAKVESINNGTVIAQVKEQTDGLAKAAEDRGFLAGGIDAKATVAADSAADARQAAMVEAIVTRLLAAQTAVLVPIAPGTPAAAVVQPVVDAIGSLASSIQATGDDTNKRVVHVEEVVAPPTPPAHTA